jgi:ribonuclease VapC
MVIDSSVVVAIVFRETDALLLANRIAEDDVRLMSAASYLETGIVVDGAPNKAKGDVLDFVLQRLHIQIEPVTPEQARLAREAYRRYGRGNHPARLNFGDCFAYALAKATGEPLLFKGDDFARTDIPAASW